ncbi:hypothetical protein FQZ97_1235250 [compost metagenome]
MANDKGADQQAVEAIGAGVFLQPVDLRVCLQAAAGLPVRGRQHEQRLQHRLRQRGAFQHADPRFQQLAHRLALIQFIERTGQ